MLTILSELVEAIIAQARQEHPIETCGIIAGPEGSNLPTRLIPMRNIAQSTSFFEFDPQQQLQVWREMDVRGEEPIVIYHSHTNSRAYPSHADVMYATEPQSHYVIIPTDSSHEREVRSFRILDGQITEERVKIVDRYKRVDSP